MPIVSVMYFISVVVAPFFETVKENNSMFIFCYLFITRRVLNYKTFAVVINCKMVRMPLSANSARV
jgi:hypothetical protein